MMKWFGKMAASEDSSLEMSDSAIQYQRLDGQKGLCWVHTMLRKD
jgi:hypothetical protein